MVSSRFGSSKFTQSENGEKDKAGLLHLKPSGTWRGLVDDIIKNKIAIIQCSDDFTIKYIRNIRRDYMTKQY